MFPTICKIGPLSTQTYTITVAVIAGIGIVILIVMAFLGGMRRRAVTAVIFWTLVLAVLAMIPMLSPVTIHSYGLMFAVAVLICTPLLVIDAKRKNISADVIFDLIFWIVIGGIIGARLFYIALNYSFFVDNPAEMIMIQNGGLAWQGGLILATGMAISFIRKRKLFFPEMVDLLAPYLALGQSIGRIGCFLNGCCYGKVVSGGIYFPVHDATLHPTQLYMSGGLFVIFLILKRYQRSSEIPGLVFASYLILTSVLRFGVEFFRADHKVFYFGFSVFQFVCFGVLIFAFGFAYLMLIKHSNPDESL